MGSWEGEICLPVLGSPRQKFHPQSIKAILSESLICGLDVTIFRWKHSSIRSFDHRNLLEQPQLYDACRKLVGSWGAALVISKVSRIPVAYISFNPDAPVPNHLSSMRNRWRSWQLRRKQKTLSCRAATSPSSLSRAISAEFEAEGRK